MMMAQPQIIELCEYQPIMLGKHEIVYADAETIYKTYRSQIEIDEPSMKNNSRWQLTSLGWVGSIPVHAGLRLVLKPKVPVKSIFRMLEYAYRLKSFQILDGITESDELDDIYQRLANIIARRVLDRARRGFYREYIDEEDRLPYIRGSINMARSLRSPWNVDLHCAYQEQTADIQDNQILAWTLYVITRQGICSGDVLENVRAAWRSLHGVATTQRCRAADCVGRLYNRLNNDYQPLHALCRFFLEHTGPGQSNGNHDMLPFLVNMSRLYELYVAEYLAQKLPPHLHLTPQDHLALTKDNTINITIDMVLENTRTGETVAVLDTKYKNADKPSPHDLQQIVAYAVAKNCARAVLIYPVIPKAPFNQRYGQGEIEVITTSVSVDGEIGERLAEMIR